MQQPQQTKICDIEEDVKNELKKFCFKKSTSNSALILKVDREQKKVCIDNLIEDTNLADLREIIPSHQPRYIIYAYKMTHLDGRLSFPICFIFYTPRDSHMELQMMYAGTKMALQYEAKLSRSYEIRELDELTDEWLQEKIGK